MKCNWGILGPGFVATRAVIPALQQLSQAAILAVASSSTERGQLTAHRFGIERVYSDYQALLNDKEVDAVYIALPNHLHKEWTIRAAQAGKHVLCEKPLALSAAECDSMIAACHKANVLLMEAVMYRFHPRMLYLKQMLDAGDIGNICFLHAGFSFPFDSPDNYRASAPLGGGALLDVGSYCVNAARWLISDEPQIAQRYISYRDGIDVATSALLLFAQNASAHVQCSFTAAEHQVIEVVGSTGAVTAPLAFTAWNEDSTFLLIQRGSHFERKEFAPSDPYQLMVNHFTACVLGKQALLFPPEDGRATLRVLDQMRNEKSTSSSH